MAKKTSVTSKDPKKEAVFDNLREQLEEAGFQVRREQLKRGPGWKVLSGSCVAKGERLLFVDRRMSQDEQIAFLRYRLQTLEANPSSPILGAVDSNAQVVGGVA